VCPANIENWATFGSSWAAISRSAEQRWRQPAAAADIQLNADKRSFPVQYGVFKNPHPTSAPMAYVEYSMPNFIKISAK